MNEWIYRIIESWNHRRIGSREPIENKNKQTKNSRVTKKFL